jgi:hypothetical protein
MDQGVVLGGHGLRLKRGNVMRISVACPAVGSIGTEHINTGGPQGYRRQIPAIVLR